MKFDVASCFAQWPTRCSWKVHQQGNSLPPLLPRSNSYWTPPNAIIIKRETDERHTETVITILCPLAFFQCMWWVGKGREEEDSKFQRHVRWELWINPTPLFEAVYIQKFLVSLQIFFRTPLAARADQSRHKAYQRQQALKALCSLTDWVSALGPDSLRRWREIFWLFSLVLAEILFGKERLQPQEDLLPIQQQGAKIGGNHGIMTMVKMNE